MWVLGHFIVTQLIRNTFITINENPPFGSFVFPPTLPMTHLASCLTLTGRPWDQWFILLNLTKINIVFLREAICGLQYAENASAAGALPRAPLGELTTLQDLLVGWEGTPLPRPHTTRRLRRSGLPPTHNFWLRHWEGGDGNRGQRRGSPPPPFRIHGSASDPTPILPHLELAGHCNGSS